MMKVRIRDKSKCERHFYDGKLFVKECREGYDVPQALGVTLLGTVIGGVSAFELVPESPPAEPPQAEEAKDETPDPEVAAEKPETSPIDEALAKIARPADDAEEPMPIEGPAPVDEGAVKKQRRQRRTKKSA